MNYPESGFDKSPVAYQYAGNFIRRLFLNVSINDPVIDPLQYLIAFEIYIPGAVFQFSQCLISCIIDQIPQVLQCVFGIIGRPVGELIEFVKQK